MPDLDAVCSEQAWLLIVMTSPDTPHFYKTSKHKDFVP